MPILLNVFWTRKKFPQNLGFPGHYGTGINRHIIISSLARRLMAGRAPRQLPPCPQTPLPPPLPEVTSSKETFGGDVINRSPTSADDIGLSLCGRRLSTDDDIISALMTSYPLPLYSRWSWLVCRALCRARPAGRRLKSVVETRRRPLAATATSPSYQRNRKRYFFPRTLGAGHMTNHSRTCWRRPSAGAVGLWRRGWSWSDEVASFSLGSH